VRSVQQLMVLSELSDPDKESLRLFCHPVGQNSGGHIGDDLC
jgi:hypothetical protein